MNQLVAYFGLEAHFPSWSASRQHRQRSAEFSVKAAQPYHIEQPVLGDLANERLSPTEPQADSSLASQHVRSTTVVTPFKCITTLMILTFAYRSPIKLALFIVYRLDFVEISALREWSSMTLRHAGQIELHKWNDIPIHRQEQLSTGTSGVASPNVKISSSPHRLVKQICTVASQFALSRSSVVLSDQAKTGLLLTLSYLCLSYVGWMTSQQNMQQAKNRPETSVIRDCLPLLGIVHNCHHDRSSRRYANLIGHSSACATEIALFGLQYRLDSLPMYYINHNGSRLAYELKGESRTGILPGSAWLRTAHHQWRSWSSGERHE
nr:hypothetical protein CFP56_28671 [Quercus suber]